MRRTKLLFSSILATVLGMGVIGGVVATKNIKEVRQVEAASGDATGRAYTFYCNWGAGTADWATKYVGYCTSTSGDAWTWQAMTQVSGSLWSANITNTNVKRLIFRHTQNYYKGCSTDPLWTSDVNGIQNRFNITSRNPDADPGFYGSWAWESSYGYTVNYNSNGGSGTMSSHTMWIYSDSGGSTVHTNTFTRTGYNFTGWNTKSDGSGRAVSNGATLNYGDALSMVKDDTVTLYAQWSKKTYTLTFNPNGGTGSQTTRTKTHDVAFTIPTPQSLNINAGPARVMLSWNTKSDGSGATYKIDGTSTYTANSAETFYLQQGFKSYEYSVDGGSTWVQMAKIATATDCVATYASDPSNYLPAGQIVTIRSYYDGVQAHIIQATDTWTGNTYAYGGNHYISIGTHNKIVLYVTNGGLYNVDVWGGSERGIAINRSGFETKYECTLNETTHNYTGTVTVLPGDKIEAFHSYATTYSITMTNYSAYGIDVNGNVSVPAVYQLTLTWDGTDGGYPTVNVDSMIAVDTATLIAQTFNNDMTPLCTNVEGGSAPSTLVTQWGVEAGYYAKLTTATQNILNGTTATSDTYVIAMQAKYDRIVGKYNRSISSINDYMGRNPAPIGRTTGSILLQSFTTGSSQGALIVILVATISAGAVGGYFFIRRKKQK